MVILLSGQKVSSSQHCHLAILIARSVFDDTGCPHTLEQYVSRPVFPVLNSRPVFRSLVFMGSEKYPYKGIIDHFANRGFSNGTNAWTDTDHTAYTVSTAGEQGFLQLLPIFVDHILYPTITNAGFVTEVRHCPIIYALRQTYCDTGPPYRSQRRRFRCGL